MTRRPVLAAGFVEEVRKESRPFRFGSGKRCLGSVDAQHLSEDAEVVIQGGRVLHLRHLRTPRTELSGESRRRNAESRP